MAKDIKFLVGGSVEKAEKAMRELQRTGSDVVHRLERDFNQLGTSSSTVFDQKRKAAQSAYERIKQSGIATSDELKRAERSLGDELASIDEQQFGKRLTMAEKFRKNWVKIAAAAGAVAGVGVAGFTLGKKAINEYQEFETALTDLSKVTDENLGTVQDKIMALPAELGSATELVQGYYQTISAGVTDPERAMALLTTAAKASKAAHVDQSTTIQGLTKLMAGFGDEITDATEASDLLFAMEKSGQTTFAELVPVIGNVASLSHQAGVNSKEMAAMLSRITQTAGSTSQAATQYSAIIRGLIKPTNDMEEALQEMGYQSGEAAVKNEGLSGVLQKLNEHSKASGTSMSDLFESSEALTGLGPLLADQFEGYNTTLGDVEKSAGATDAAFSKWQGTFAAVKDAFNNTLGKVLIQLGEELTPYVMDVMEGMTEWITTNQDKITSFVQGVGSVISFVSDLAVSVYNVIGDVARGIAELTLQIENSTVYQFLANGTSQITSGFGLLSDDSSSTSSSSSTTSSSKLFPNLSYASGTSYVPETGYYQLHRGEAVSTRSEVATGQNQQSVSFGDMQFVLPNVTNQSSAKDLAREALPEIMNLMRSRLRTV